MINRVRAISAHVSRARSSLIRASDYYHGISINAGEMRETRVYVTFQDNEGESLRPRIHRGGGGATSTRTRAFSGMTFRQSNAQIIALVRSVLITFPDVIEDVDRLTRPSSCKAGHSISEELVSLSLPGARERDYGRQPRGVRTEKRTVRNVRGPFAVNGIQVCSQEGPDSHLWRFPQIAT